MIEIENLTRKFGDVTAVDGLTLTIAEGEVFGLLGPNGAGKTTTIRMLAGLIGKTSGDAWVAGCRVGDPATARKLRGLVGLMPEEAGLYPDLSAARTLDFYGRLYQVTEGTRAERTERLLTMLDLWDRRDARVRTFSKGMKQRLTIARALINDPPVLFLDEPTANLDPEGAKTVRDFLLQLKQEKRTILLNTHQLTEAERVCDRVGIMHTKLVAVGTPDGLRGTASQHATAIQLAVVTDAVVAAAAGKPRSRADVTVSGNTITIGVGKPERDNPELVKAIVAAGGEIQFVSGLVPTLEETYLKLLGDEKNETEGREVTAMNWQNVATIARKDMTIMMTRRSLRIGLAVLPLGLAVLFSQIIAHGNIPADALPQDAERVPLLLHDLHRGAAREHRVLQHGRREGRAQPRAAARHPGDRRRDPARQGPRGPRPAARRDVGGHGHADGPLRRAHPRAPSGTCTSRTGWRPSPCSASRRSWRSWPSGSAC